jgi:hypothetical protein
MVRRGELAQHTAGFMRSRCGRLLKNQLEAVRFGRRSEGIEPSIAADRQSVSATARFRIGAVINIANKLSTARRI